MDDFEKINEFADKLDKFLDEHDTPFLTCEEALELYQLRKDVAVARLKYWENETLLQKSKAQQIEINTKELMECEKMIKALKNALKK